ncbi:MAG TPA: antibiotic biosynthesis monooxygenase [Pyrinomonadaceae bacterium]|jgi:heme-degrading monooxygenase HmoA
MKKATLLFVGLICVALSGFSTEAGRHDGGAQLPSGSAKTVVARQWRGRVAPARAEEYYRYLFDGVKKIRSIPGSLGVQVMRREEEGAVEFIVISYWESRKAIEAYAGKDIEKPRHLPRDREFLLELPTRVLHYEVTYTDLAQVRVGQ